MPQASTTAKATRAALVADAKPDAPIGKRRCVECGTVLPAPEGPGRPRVRCGRVECDQARREQIAAHRRAYYEANREQIAAYQRAYYEANREQIAAHQRAYYEANKPTGPLVRVCVSCAQEFTQPRRQAHPFMRCEPCRTTKGDQP